MSIRKELLAKLDAAHRIVNESDEFEADNKAQRAVRDATNAEVAEAKAQLQRIREEVVNADVEHQRWREASSAERAKTNAEIDRLQAELRTLDVQVKERRAEADNILAGIRSLTARLKMG